MHLYVGKCSKNTQNIKTLELEKQGNTFSLNDLSLKFCLRFVPFVSIDPGDGELAEVHRRPEFDPEPDHLHPHQPKVSIHFGFLFSHFGESLCSTEIENWKFNIEASFRSEGRRKK